MKAAEIIGTMGVVFCVAMFASPLSALKSVLATKSAKSIPLPFTLAAIVNCFLWSVVGLMDMKDFNIYAPNLLGLLFGLIQLALKLIYTGQREHPPSPHPDDEPLLEGSTA
jgi:solute carrier family 50 (sugar transporter)